MIMTLDRPFGPAIRTSDPLYPELWFGGDVWEIHENVDFFEPKRLVLHKLWKLGQERGLGLRASECVPGNPGAIRFQFVRI